MRSWLILAAAVFFYTVGFTQTSQSTRETSSGSTVTPDKGISFSLPSGSWTTIPENQSLAPYMMERKIFEQIETEHKVSVIYQTMGSYSDVLSLFDQVMSIFSIHWAGLKGVQPVKLISPETAASGPRKFNAVYQIVDMLTSTPFRLEVVVISPYDMRGNKGVLMILCPEDRYYDARFLIAGIRNSLVLDVNQATGSAAARTSSPSKG